MRHVDAGESLWLAARSMLIERGGDLFRRWKAVGTGFGMDEIHDLRVSSRRLREALSLFAPCFADKRVRRFRAKVKRLTVILGTMRNTDEALLFFVPLVDQLHEQAAAAIAGLVNVLEQERETERQTLHQQLKELSPAGLHRQFLDLCNSPQLFGSNIDPLCPIVDFLKERLAEREAALLALVPEARAEADVTDQHRLRIAVKHFRYRFELCAPLAGEGFRDILESMKRYQEVLGKMHDLDVFAGLVSERINAPDAGGPVLSEIAGRRHDLFLTFLALLDQTPPEALAARIRSIL